MISTIIIPVLNRYDLLNRAIESIPHIDRLVIIDNGRGIDQARGLDAIQEHDAIGESHILSMPEPLGVAASWNLGIKATPHSDHGWLLMNSDAWFEPGAFDVYESLTSPDRIVLGGQPGWCCAFIGSDVVRRVGLFCERFHPAYMEDIDYERRARIHDIEIIYSDAIIGHDNSSTIAASPALARKNAETHAANRAFYEYRWNILDANGIPATHEWSLDTTLRQSW